MKITVALPPSLLALAIAASALPMTTHAAGFVEDAKVTLGLRNYYFNRNYLNNSDPRIQGDLQGQAEGWTQSF
ncbi:MAG: OprD family outer membrane porin, partial [Pseudomonas sp.]|uniref:OprD family outer membrane porin n=1 Tax=Pseudomonas sp. TaxID=306 RepID=UPI003D14C6DB